MNNVSLENVIVKENDSIVVGTVKVKNISFHKEVIVRTTWDDWKSQEDIFCTYSPVCVGETSSWSMQYRMTAAIVYVILIDGFL